MLEKPGNETLPHSTAYWVKSSREYVLSVNYHRFNLCWLTLFLLWVSNGTYRFYSVWRQTILLVGGDPLGWKGLKWLIVFGLFLLVMVKIAMLQEVNYLVTVLITGMGCLLFTGRVRSILVSFVRCWGWYHSTGLHQEMEVSHEIKCNWRH